MGYPKQKNGGITNSQKALIHMAKAKLGMDEETYREMLRNVAGVRAAREDRDGMGIDSLVRMGGEESLPGLRR